MQEIFDLPLYAPYGINDQIWAKIRDKDNTTFDSFCIKCNRHATFQLVDLGQLPSPPLIELNNAPRCHLPSSYVPKYALEYIPFLYLHFECTRDKYHRIGMMLQPIDGRTIMKVGQYPSLADSQLPDYKKFSKCISNDRLKEIKTAVGLSAHGVGIGAFVYLRRVIEHLVNDACEKAKEDGKAVEGKVLERISSLQGYLPDTLIKNKEAYAILSKGIHELSDDECSESFSLMKALIDLILEEKLAKRNMEKKQKEIEREVSERHSELKNTKK